MFHEVSKLKDLKGEVIVERQHLAVPTRYCRRSMRRSLYISRHALSVLELVGFSSENKDISTFETFQKRLRDGSDQLAAHFYFHIGFIWDCTDIRHVNHSSHLSSFTDHFLVRVIPNLGVD